MSPAVILLLIVASTLATGGLILIHAMRVAGDGYENESGFIAGPMPALVRNAHLTPGTIARASAAPFATSSTVPQTASTPQAPPTPPPAPASGATATVVSASPFPVTSSTTRTSSSPFVVHSANASSQSTNPAPTLKPAAIPAQSADPFPPAVAPAPKPADCKSSPS